MTWELPRFDRLDIVVERCLPFDKGFLLSDELLIAEAGAWIGLPAGQHPATASRHCGREAFWSWLCPINDGTVSSRLDAAFA